MHTTSNAAEPRGDDCSCLALAEAQALSSASNAVARRARAAAVGVGWRSAWPQSPHVRATGATRNPQFVQYRRSLPWRGMAAGYQFDVEARTTKRMFRKRPPDRLK